MLIQCCCLRVCLAAVNVLSCVPGYAFSDGSRHFGLWCDSAAVDGVVDIPHCLPMTCPNINRTVEHGHYQQMGDVTGAAARLQCDAEYYASEPEELRYLPALTSDIPQWLPVNSSVRCLSLLAEIDPPSDEEGPRRRLLQTQSNNRPYYSYGYYNYGYTGYSYYDTDVYYPYRNTYWTGYSYNYWGQRWGQPGESRDGH